MLFNSIEFCFEFLPAALLIWYLVKRFAGLSAAVIAMAVLSLIFYSQWNIAFLPILGISILVNFHVGTRIIQCRSSYAARARNWMRAGIAFNLALLGWFKYANFIGGSLASLGGFGWTWMDIALPLGLSFITFQKIAYLVDCHRGLVKNHSIDRYMFFVTFFPQLIAGPIVHHEQLTSQLSDKNPLFSDISRAAALGSFLFSVGLFKKVGLADALAAYATPVFDFARTAEPQPAQALMAMLAYTGQLYFDFSGYSDMAIGLGLMFGLKLPINFASPYKSTSLIDFWRRWHITLSAFLRNYLYIPLGGNKAGVKRHYANLFLTMLLAGFWHGAGWTFVVWGAVHGVGLVVNHVWRSLWSWLCVHGRVNHRFGHRGSLGWISAIAGRGAAWGLTFGFVALGWVLFRAADLPTALRMYSALLQVRLVDLAGSVTQVGPVEFLAAQPRAGWLWVLVGLAIALLAPRGVQLARYDARPNVQLEKPSLLLGLATGLLFWLGVKWMAAQPATEFLYFNF